MPARIPVQVANRQFVSTNKARIHFTDILRQYSEGAVVREEHQNEIKDLMVSSGSTYPIRDCVVKVSRGYFGRQCFVSVGADQQPHYVSIVHSLKKCVKPLESDDKFH